MEGQACEEEEGLEHGAVGALNRGKEAGLNCDVDVSLRTRKRSWWIRWAWWRQWRGRTGQSWQRN